MTKKKKQKYIWMGIGFFILLFLMNGVLFPMSDKEEITNELMIKTAASSFIGSLIFVVITFLLNRYVEKDED